MFTDLSLENAHEKKPSSRKQVGRFDIDTYNSMISDYKTAQKNVFYVSEVFFSSGRKKLFYENDGVSITVSESVIKSFKKQLDAKLKEVFDFGKRSKKRVSKPRAPRDPSVKSVLSAPYFVTNQLVGYYSHINFGCGFNIGLTEMNLDFDLAMEYTKIDCSTSEGIESFLEKVGGKKKYVDFCNEAQKKFLEENPNIKEIEITVKNIETLLNPKKNMDVLIKHNIMYGTSQRTIESIISKINETKTIYEGKAYEKSSPVMNKYLNDSENGIKLMVGKKELNNEIPETSFKDQNDYQKYLFRKENSSKSLYEVLDEYLKTFSSTKNPEKGPLFVRENDGIIYKHEICMIIESFFRISKLNLDEKMIQKLKDNAEESEEFCNYFKRIGWSLKALESTKPKAPKKLSKKAQRELDEQNTVKKQEQDDEDEEEDVNEEKNIPLPLKVKKEEVSEDS